ncbi:cytochrome P450 [Saccharopolyspora spinosa]
MVSAPLSDEGAAIREKAKAARESYLVDLIVDTRGRIDPAVDVDDQPSLASALIVAADEHDRLAERELIGTIKLLLIAGHETTVNLIGNGVLALLADPGQLELLRSKPELLGPLSRRCCRFDRPVERATPRFAVEDVEIGGVTIPADSVGPWCSDRPTTTRCTPRTAAASTSPAPTAATCPSAKASTTAWAYPSPASKVRCRSVPCWTVSRTSLSRPHPKTSGGGPAARVECGSAPG